MNTIGKRYRNTGLQTARRTAFGGLKFLSVFVVFFAVFVLFGVGSFAESRFIDVGLWYGRLSPTWVTLESDEPYHVVIMKERAGEIGKTKANGRNGDKRLSFPLLQASGAPVYRVGLEPYRDYYVQLEVLSGWNDGADPEEARLLEEEYLNRMAYYRQAGLSPVFVYEEYPAIAVLFSDYDEAVHFVENSGFGGAVLGGANCFLVTSSDGAAVGLLSALNRDAMVYAGVSDMGCSQAQKTYKYRGGFRYTLGSAGYFSLVNRVDIEEYLYGVVPVEMSASWHIESLKSQAVAARNYAVFPSGKYARFGFDVDDSVESQAYDGYSAEHPRSTEAVDATRGEYMLYDDEVIHMFFNASSGGYLDSAKNIWGGENLPYLVPKPDPYSVGYTWTYELTPSFMEEVIAEMGRDVGEPSGLEILSRTESGRVAKMRIIGLTGSFEATGEHFKAVVNSRKFKSSLFTFDKDFSENIFKEEVDFNGQDQSSRGNSDKDSGGKQGPSRMPAYQKISDIVGGAVSENPPTYSPNQVEQQGSQKEEVGDSKYVLQLPQNEIVYFLNDRILIYGHGYGHGIGLSQLGAVKMAELGKRYTEILEFYYNQVESVKK